MSDEGELSVRAFLEQRLEVLIRQCEGAMVVVERYKAEIDQARRALAALTPASTAHHYELDLDIGTYFVAGSGADTRIGPTIAEAKLVADATIKELIFAALKTNKQFRLYGAQANELIRYIKSEFSRDIDRASISPTLSRMRDEGVVQAHQSSSGTKWRLPVYVPKRGHYPQIAKTPPVQSDSDT